MTAMDRARPASKLVGGDVNGTIPPRTFPGSLIVPISIPESPNLRPDPTRVVVRPFKPATEPRDLNPTDKIRANHIVGRVLRLDAEAAQQQLSDVLDNFEGRHRNLIDIFEARAAD